MSNVEGAALPSQMPFTRHPGETLLLAIAPRQDIASGIETRLRDAGRNVRVDWLDKPANLQEYLESHDPALFCCQAFDNGIDTSQALLQRCLNAESGIPVVLLDEVDARQQAEMMRAGARDVIPPKNAEHLTAALMRELDIVKLAAGAQSDRQRLEQMDIRLQALIAESEDARATIQEGIHAQLNPSYARLFGFESPEELEGVPLMDLVAPQDRDPVKKKLAVCRKGKADKEPIRFTGRRADDSQCSVLMHCLPIQFEGEDAIEVVIPHTPYEAPRSDVQTRAALYHAMAQPRTKADGDIDGLYFLTIDDLTGLQEQLGLVKADSVLDEFALFLLGAIKPDDDCFRFGPGEFVVIASRDSVEEMRSDAETLCAAIDDEVFGDDDTAASLTASIAVNVIGAGTEPEVLLLRAMQRARETSAKDGNAVTLETASEGHLSEETADQDWLELVKEGLRQDRFTFAYQSIASLEGEETEHFDVILRLIGNDGEILLPQQFVDSANRHNLLPQIDRLVTGKILTLLAQRRERGIQGMFFVKLSGATLNEAPKFLDWLRGNLAERKVDPKELRFSLTEDAMRGNIRRAQQLAEGLDDMGLALTIEQFGTTGKSIQLLERVPVEFAKLDATATEALAGDDSDPRIVEAVEAARKRQVRLIAQQVADANTMARLWQLGISYVQGQLVQEPEIGAENENPTINVA